MRVGHPKVRPPKMVPRLVSLNLRLLSHLRRTPMAWCQPVKRRPKCSTKIPIFLNSGHPWNPSLEMPEILRMRIRKLTDRRKSSRDLILTTEVIMLSTGQAPNYQKPKLRGRRSKKRRGTCATSISILAQIWQNTTQITSKCIIRVSPSWCSEGIYNFRLPMKCCFRLITSK